MQRGGYSVLQSCSDEVLGVSERGRLSLRCRPVLLISPTGSVAERIDRPWYVVPADDKGERAADHFADHLTSNGVAF